VGGLNFHLPSHNPSRFTTQSFFLLRLYFITPYYFTIMASPPENVEELPTKLITETECAALPEVTQEARPEATSPVMLSILDKIDDVLHFAARACRETTGSPVTPQSFDSVKRTVQQVARKVAKDFDPSDKQLRRYFLIKAFHLANQEFYQMSASPEAKEFFGTVEEAFEVAKQELDQRAKSIGTQSLLNTAHQTLQMDAQKVNEAATSSATQKPVDTVKQISSTMDSATE
jgi:hypothetical protein